MMKLKKGLISFLVLLLIQFNLAAQYNYDDALVKSINFFDANKCGANVSDNNVFSWRGACHTTDAANSLNLSGGFHDAGDHVKFGLPQCWSAATLGFALYEYRSAFDNAGATPKLLSTLKHFTDYFLKCHPNANTFYYNIGDGGADHGYWGAPENQTGVRPVIAATPTKPASDVCGQASAALALMYLNYKDVNAAYATQCLNAAKSIYTLGLTYKGRSDDGGGGVFYKSSSHFDDLSWGAIWLSIATNDNSYIQPVDAWLDVRNDYGDDNYDKHWAPAWDDVTVYVLAKMYELTGLDKYRTGVINNLEWCRDECRKTPAGLPWIDKWGVLRYASAEAGLGYLANKTLEYDGYVQTANLTMNYALGTNPRNSSYITGWGVNPPVHPHHRANEPDFYHPHSGNTNGIVGGLVGGPDQNDGYSDNIADFERSEVGLDYNASFILGLAGKIFNEGADETDKLVVAPASLSLSSTAQSATLQITSNINWNLSNQLSWATVNATSGSGNAAVIVSVNVNTSTNSRTGEITISGGTYTRTITITQASLNSEKPNIALNKPVSASSTEAGSGNIASNAVDGNAATRWSSLYTDPQWIQVDLQATYDITNVILKWEAASAKSYSVEVSDNGSNFTNLTTKTNMPNGARVDNLPVSGTGRYIRIYGTARTTLWGYSLFELEVQGNPVAPVSVTGVSLSPASAIINAGSTQQLTALIAPTNATNKVVSYQSNNTSVATVSSTGLVTGIAQGTAIITATTQDGQFTATISIQVNRVQFSGGFTVSGTKLLDANGNEFIMRGINVPFVWYYGFCMDNLESIKNNTKSNSIRIVWDTSGKDADMKAAIQKCIDLEMIPMIELHDVTCSNDVARLQTMAKWFADRASYFTSPEIAKYVLINIANEWGDWYMGTQAWRDAYKTAITTIRNSGIKTTLVIDGPDCGKNMEVIRDAGGDLNAHDAGYLGGKSNLVMGVHFYCRYTNASDIENGLATLLGKNLAVFVGEFGQEHPNGSGGVCDIPEYDIIRICQERGIGYMPWSWKGNNAETAMLDMSSDWAGNSLTAWGSSVVNGTYGIKNTSIKATVFNDTPIDVTGVTLTPATLTVNMGSSFQLISTVIPANASNKTVSYTSSNTGVATVNSSGLLNALSAGNTVVTVTTQQGGFMASSNVTITVAPKNIALKKPVFVSSTEAGANVAANAVDGIVTTRWSSQYTNPQWIYVDLLENYTLSKVKLIWEAAFGKAYEIQVSDDAVVWNSAYSTTNGDGATDEINITEEGRYVRIYCSQKTTEWGYSLWEFEVYGELNASSVVAKAGADISAIDTDENGFEIIALNGTASVGDITAYSWKANDVVIATQATANVSLPVGTHIVVLEVTGADGSTSHDEITVTVKAKSSGTGYAYGILPANANPEDAANMYLTIKERYLEYCPDGKARIKWGQSKYPWENPTLTVSEGIGYGMLLAAYFDDKQVFDALWKYYNSFLNANGFMNWETSGCNGTVQFNGATDSELDCAMALVIAAERWSTSANYNYQTEAKSLIAKIKTHEVEQGSYVLKPGDVWGGSDLTNISYYSPAYYKIFGQYTNDVVFWNNVADKGYEVISNNLRVNNAVGGLVSDWCNAAGNAAGGKASYYFYDAIRTPWRIAVDYAWFGDARAKDYLDKTNTFINTRVGGIDKVMDGYNQDGSLLTSQGTRYHNTTATATFACAGIALTDVSVLNNYYTEMEKPDTVSYFDHFFLAFGKTFLNGMFYNPLEPQGNKNPIALAGNDQTLIDSDGNGSELVTLNGSASYDSDGSIASYEWTINEAVIGTTAIITQNLLLGTHQITLKVTDNLGASASDIVVVIVNPIGENLPPVANAGADQTLVDADENGSEMVTLNGSNSTDADGTIASYQWLLNGSQVSANAVFTTELAVGNHVFTLIVTDNQGKTGTDQVTVSVEPNETACSFGAPVASALADFNKTYTFAHVLGDNGPNLSAVTSFTINWSLTYNGLWQFSFNTSNGIPAWWVDLLPKVTHNLNSTQPGVTLSGTGIAGLDGSYWIAIDGTNFVMVEKTGTHTLYFSNSSVKPSCRKSATVGVNSTFNNEFLVYPNPFNDAITIDLPQNLDVRSIQLFNTVGSLVTSINNVNENRNTLKLDGNNKGGIYILRIIHENGVENIPVIRE